MGQPSESSAEHDDAPGVPGTPSGTTAVELAQQVRSGAVTARQVVERTLAAIEAGDVTIGSFQVVRGEQALAEADRVDRRADRSELPLAGVPVAIKDNISVTGEPMRDGSLGSDGSPQTTDHPIVRRLRDAGAVVVGITRCPELCVFGTTDSEFGLTRNPWNLQLTPGGSSGGSAAAVAAGLVPIAHGNDGMGSIRIPAACCGLVGIKPGLGLVPADIGVNSWFDMAENGPFATTVADAALMLSVMAGRPELASIDNPGSVRVAVSTKPPLATIRVDPHWASAATESGALLRKLGHRVAAADPPYGQALGVRGMARWTAGTEIEARALADRTQLNARVKRHAGIGKVFLALGLPRSRGRVRWQARAERFFGEFDVLVTPALARTPIAAIDWRHEGWFANIWSNAKYAPFAAPWNIAGWPAMTVPAGLTRRPTRGSPRFRGSADRHRRSTGTIPTMAAPGPAPAGPGHLVCGPRIRR